MFDLSSLARFHARLALAVVGSALLMTGCVKPIPAQPDAKLTITATQPSGTYEPGDDVKFRVTVTNVGTVDVSYVEITTSLNGYALERSMTCSPLGQSAATNDPAECGSFIYMRSLAKGASVTLDIVATLAGNAPATVANTFSASALRGPAEVTASNQAIVVDTRSGPYKAFASDGHQFDLAADFASVTFTFAGNGASTVLPASLVPNIANYFFADKGSFMAHHDLLAGNAPLDGVTPVFLAARKFVATVGELDGQVLSTFGIATPASGASTSFFETIAFSGATLQVCADATPHTLATCPVGSLRNYDLTVANGVFTGVDTADADTLTFQVAQSDSALVFLRAEATPAGHVFQVGLPSNAVVTDTELHGADTTGLLNGTLEFTGGFVEESFGLDTRAGDMSPVAGGPTGLLSSVLKANTMPVWLAEDSGLAVVMGQPGSSTDGLLQVFAY